MIKEDNLIFLISQPRSGSTIIQKILTNNDHIATASEPWILLPFAGMVYPHLNNSTYNSKVASIGIKEFLSEKEEEKFKTDLKEMILGIYTKKINDSLFFLDKTPRYYEILDFIQEFFPKARIIILKRNPFAVLNSIIDTWNVKNFIKLGQYYRDLVVAPFLIQEFADKNLHNPNVAVVRYEDFINNPDSFLVNIFNWLGISYDKSYLDYNQNFKLQGKYGDPIGVKKFSTITNENQNVWNGKFKEEYWSDFFMGYADYLGADFLNKYGDYNAPLIKRTQSFKDFEFYFKNNLTSYPVQSLKSFYKLGRITLNCRLNKYRKKFYF